MAIRSVPRSPSLQNLNAESAEDLSDLCIAIHEFLSARDEMQILRCALLKIGDPLTRPAPAGENAGRGPPSPPRGREAVKKWAVMLSEAKHLHLSS
jgi:hypothetical protein